MILWNNQYKKLSKTNQRGKLPLYGNNDQDGRAG